MVNGTTGRIVFLASLVVAFLILMLEGSLEVHGAKVPPDFDKVLIACLSFAAGSAGVNPVTTMLSGMKGEIHLISLDKSKEHVEVDGEVKS